MPGLAQDVPVHGRSGLDVGRGAQVHPGNAHSKTVRTPADVPVRDDEFGNLNPAVNLNAPRSGPAQGTTTHRAENCGRFDFHHAGLRAACRPCPRSIVVPGRPRHGRPRWPRRRPARSPPRHLDASTSPAAQPMPSRLNHNRSTRFGDQRPTVVDAAPIHHRGRCLPPRHGPTGDVRRRSYLTPPPQPATSTTGRSRIVGRSEIARVGQVPRGVGRERIRPASASASVGGSACFLRSRGRHGVALILQPAQHHFHDERYSTASMFRAWHRNRRCRRGGSDRQWRRCAYGLHRPPHFRTPPSP